MGDREKQRRFRRDRKIAAHHKLQYHLRKAIEYADRANAAEIERELHRLHEDSKDEQRVIRGG